MRLQSGTGGASLQHNTMRLQSGTGGASLHSIVSLRLHQERASASVSEVRACGRHDRDRGGVPGLKPEIFFFIKFEYKGQRVQWCNG